MRGIVHVPMLIDIIQLDFFGWQAVFQHHWIRWMAFLCRICWGFPAIVILSSVCLACVKPFFEGVIFAGMGW